MRTIENLIQRVKKTQHGFLDIQKAADQVFSGHPAEESLQLVDTYLKQYRAQTGQ